MTYREFVISVIGDSDLSAEYTREQAAEDFKAFQDEGYEIPDGMTADDYWEAYRDYLLYAGCLDRAVYVAQANEMLAPDINGDSHLIAVTFDRESALKAIENDMAHTTRREAKNRTWDISTYTIPCADDDAEKAFMAWQFEQCWLPDPETWEEVPYDHGC